MGPTSPVDFILQPPVFHPVLPYITTIFGGLTRGKMVLVQGVVFAEAERFQVDFQCGCSVMPRPDIAIHFNPRFRSRPHVICNTLQNGRWLEETKFPHLPLKRGEAFQLLFLFGQDEVQPFDASRTEYPVAHPMQLNSSKLAVPYCHPLPRGLASRDTIIVRGLVCPVPEGFSLSLREDPSHVPLRLSTCFRTRALMWSSFPDGALSHTEKVAACFPFHPQRFFELLLVCEEGSFKLALNGIPLGQYDTPWLSWDRITELWIEGDVTLYSVLS
ncbi:galectin-12 isoform X3 [Malaclemys terrapin pileata]|uniref:galectin-12 isoform X3 n=1 Tax=Malaclemys terrapin pileata TaxID=2991368 RepID=UPI0023A815DE|nr:galectin-12 isoform X3 [Malaclemys terrapin pileata]